MCLVPRLGEMHPAPCEMAAGLMVPAAWTGAPEALRGGAFRGGGVSPSHRQLSHLSFPVVFPIVLCGCDSTL